MDAPKKILLADDEPEFLETYRKFVEKAGLESLLARDGEEAVKMALEEKPDIVVLDVDMPKKDGLEVMREIRSVDWGKDLPIIILTGKDPDEARLEAISQWHPTFYFVKGSQSADEFINVLRDILDGKSGEA